MAYVPDTEQSDEEKKAEQDKYAALLGGGAPASMGGAPAAAPAQQPQRSGFVSMDRYLNANRSTVDNMVQGAKSDLNARADKVGSDLNSTTSGLTGQAAANTLSGPGSNTHVAETNAATTQAQALGSLKSPDQNAVSDAQALANANTAYAGPSAADAKGKYDALYGDYSKVKDDADASAKYGIGASKRWNAFDNMLGNADGGKNVGDITNKVGQLKSTYDTDSQAATGAIKTAAASHSLDDPNSAASKWQALDTQFKTDQQTRAANAQAGAETKRNAEFDDRANHMYNALHIDRPANSTGRPKGIELARALDPFSEKAANMTALGGSSKAGQDFQKQAQVFDKMSDDEVHHFMALLTDSAIHRGPVLNSNGPMAAFMKNMNSKYGGA